jgi:signal transduction histidine kinase
VVQFGGKANMTDSRHTHSQNIAKQARSVFTLGKIAAATADSAAIAEATGKRLLGRIAAAVAEQIGGLSLVSVSERSLPGPVSVVVRHPKHRVIEVTPPARPDQNNAWTELVARWPTDDRFVSGDLGETLDLAPPYLSAEFAERRHGALALLPLGQHGSPSGIMLAHRPGRSFNRHERDFMRAVRVQTSLALQLRETLHRADDALAAREAFLKLASHELSGPLATALLLISAIELSAGRNGAHMDASTKNSVHLVKHQLDRASAILRQLTNVVRRAHHIADLQREDLNLGELVASVIDELRIQDPRAETLQFDRGDSSVRGRWDRGQLEQLVHNLLGNALKFGQGRPVRITVGAASGGVQLAVQDEGIGIDPAEHDRIFECFARAVSGREYQGLGLGLWLVREIVAAHGGRVSVDSHPGEGSRFEIWLPLGVSKEGTDKDGPLIAPVP